MDEEEYLSEADLWQRCQDKRRVAEALRSAEGPVREIWMACGFAVEFALKARIMMARQLNAWPERKENPELHTHNLRRLVAEAGIDLTKLSVAQRASWHVVLDWERHHDYNARHMPAAIADDMMEAAFGSEGVVIWLKNLT